MWLFGKRIDIGFLFIPVWLTWVVAFVLPSETLQTEIPLWFWVVFVLIIDVGHVWSTIFRTYLEKQESKSHQRILGLAPIVCFVLLFLLAFESINWFWRVMAYLALFHFVKQQYGFFALYSYKSRIPKVKRLLNDKFILYLTMVFPVLYWHFQAREFNWFTTGDFFSFSLFTAPIWDALCVAYWLLIIGWIAEDVWLANKHNYKLSIGRMLWLLSTAVNWYLGIVFFNSDLVFTMTNVVAHGIPYLVLVVMYQQRKRQVNKKVRYTQLASVIIGGAILLGFVEEYLWDYLINHDKYDLFIPVFEYPQLSPALQAFFIALLALPQVVHYVLDGYIWKMNAKNPHLKSLFRTNG